MSERTVTACLIIIGNEILSGRTQDANLAYLAKRLNEWGIRLTEARVIPDAEETIVATVNEVRAKFDYVFTTGGIGPTHDDITSECMAKAFGLKHGVHPEARALLEAHYEPGELNESRLRMAMTPEGAQLITNAVSWAPGFQVENVFVLAGVPKVMQSMLDGLRERLSGGAAMRSCALRVELPEGVLAQGLRVLQARYPAVEMGSYPFHEDSVLDLKNMLGADRMLLGSDWPHAEGLPDPTEFANELEGFTDAEVKMVMRDNAEGLSRRRPV